MFLGDSSSPILPFCCGWDVEIGMEIKCQLATLKCFFCLGEYLLKTEEEGVWKEVKSGAIVGAGVKETSADSTRADGMSSCERKWLSSWVVVGGRRNAEGRQYPKKNFAWFHFSYPCFYSKVVAAHFAGLAVSASPQLVQLLRLTEPMQVPF